MVIFSYGLLYLDSIFETNLYILSFSWQRSFLKMMVKSYSWILMFPTVSVHTSYQIFFHEISCNDVRVQADRACRTDPAAYAATAIGCVVLATVLVLIMAFNHVYFIKDWINKYDNLSMNAPQYMIMFEVYLFVRAVSDALPFDEFNINVYYVRCLLIAVYTGYMLFYAAWKMVFHSLHVQQ